MRPFRWKFSTALAPSPPSAPAEEAAIVGRADSTGRGARSQPPARAAAPESEPTAIVEGRILDLQGSTGRRRYGQQCLLFTSSRRACLMS